jgi:uncharacterized phage-associated protein
MNNAQYRALDIANEFIEFSQKELSPIQHMKLQKLCYLAHGWHLALENKPLFDDSIEAWTYGPVIPSIYHEFKNFGKEPITRLGSTAYVDFGGTPPIKSDCKTVQILNRVWDVYKKFTAIQLSALTHQPDSPWSQTYLKNKNIGSLIENGLIKEYFTKALKAS